MNNTIFNKLRDKFEVKNNCLKRNSESSIYL